MADAKPHLDSWYCITYLVIFHEDPITWCLVSQNYDNVNVYSLFLPCQQIMCRIFNYRSKRVIYFWPISVNVHWAIFAPIIHATLSLDNLEVRTSLLLCRNPAVRSTESRHDVHPARCRGQLPRVTMFFRPAVMENTGLCLLSVRPTFRLAYSLGVRPAF